MEGPTLSGSEEAGTDAPTPTVQVFKQIEANSDC